MTGNFPLFKTKHAQLKQKFDLNDPFQRQEYFRAKAGEQIAAIKDYLDSGNTFVGFLLAKKQAGKGTYSKMLVETLGSKRIGLISLGDLVRKTHAVWDDPARREEKQRIYQYLKQNYRGYISLDEALQALVGRSQDRLLPTELLLALVEREIRQMNSRGIFIDGFPRDLDQISYSLYFRQIMRLRDDPDFFVLIDVPKAVIEARMQGRVVCPLCQTSRHNFLLPTQFIVYDNKHKQFRLLCDNKECQGYREQKLHPKEGDSLGLEAIHTRLERDEQLIQKVLKLHGVPKILLRNSVPVEKADEYVDDYEKTPRYSYKVDEATGRINVLEKGWVVKDDQGSDSYSLLAPVVVVSFLAQLHGLLCKKEYTG